VSKSEIYNSEMYRLKSGIMTARQKGEKSFIWLTQNRYRSIHHQLMSELMQKRYDFTPMNNVSSNSVTVYQVSWDQMHPDFSEVQNV
jgi:hypothetical protein